MWPQHHTCQLSSADGRVIIHLILLTLCGLPAGVLPCAGDEEEVVVMGGEGFTPEQIKAAEADFERRLGISLTGGWAAWLACP